MYAAPGIGLAAIQSWIYFKRLVVIDISKEEEKKMPIFLINPQIIHQSQNTSVYEEGCLISSRTVCGNRKTSRMLY